jgi:hypothetical protein
MAVHMAAAACRTAAPLRFGAAGDGAQGFDKQAGTCDNSHELRWPFWHQHPENGPEALLCQILPSSHILLNRVVIADSTTSRALSYSSEVEVPQQFSHHLVQTVLYRVSPRTKEASMAIVPTPQIIEPLIMADSRYSLSTKPASFVA